MSENCLENNDLPKVCRAGDVGDGVRVEGVWTSLTIVPLELKKNLSVRLSRDGERVGSVDGGGWRCEGESSGSSFRDSS